MLTVTIARGKSRIECTGVHNVKHGRERTGGGVGRIENGRSGEKGRMGKGKRKGQYGTGPGPDVLSHFPQFISENAV